MTRRTRAAAERSDRRLSTLGRVVPPLTAALISERRALLALFRARGDRLLRGDIPPEPIHGRVCGGGSGDHRFPWCRDCHAISCWRRYWGDRGRALTFCLNLESLRSPETLAAIDWARSRTDRGGGP